MRNTLVANYTQIIIKRTKVLKTYSIIFVLAIFLSTSCKTKEKLKKVSEMTTFDEKTLIKNIVENQLDFNSIYFKKMNVELDENGNKNSVRANMYIEKDKQIIIQVTVLIEIARILITQNEIVIVNRIEKEVYNTNFEYLNKKLNLNLNFTILQAILTNSLFSYPKNDIKQLEKYKIKKDNETITLTSETKNQETVLHEINISQKNFKILKHLIYNDLGDRIDVTYSNFENQNNSYFPKSVDLKGKNSSGRYNLSLKYTTIEKDGNDKIIFSIPPNYTKEKLLF